MALEPSTQRSIVTFAAVSPLLAVAFVCFGCTIALGVVGIVVATQSNICHGEIISSECILVEDDELSADTNVTAILQDGLPLVTDDIRDSPHYLFWLAGASVCGLLFVFIGSFCIWIAALVLYHRQPSSSGAESDAGGSMKNLNQEAAKDGDNLRLNMEYTMKILGLEKKKEKKKKEGPQDPPILIEDGLYELADEVDEKLEFQKLNIGALISLNVCFLCGILSILCLLWSFAIAFNRTKRSEATVLPFVLANFLSGIVAPALAFIFAFIAVNVFDFFSANRIQAHLILTKFLSCLTYEVGEDKAAFWVISDSLCLPINTKSTDQCVKKEHKDICCRFFGFCGVCIPSYSTILLAIIVALTMMVSFSYFIDISLVNQVSVDSCSDTNINIQYSCFRAGTLSPVDCTSNNKTQSLHCFRFYRFGVDVDFITSVSSAFAFYLLINRIFAGIFFAMKFSRVSKKKSKKKSKSQGMLFVFGGFLLLLMTGIVFLMWISGVASESVTLLAHLDILNLAQLTMFSLFIVIVGLLACQGEWKEKRPARRKMVKFENHDGDGGITNEFEQSVGV